MNLRRRATVLLILMSLFGAASLTLSGCSGKSVNESDPASLYADAEDDIKSDRYQIALEKLKTVKNKFPYSKYAIDAQLRIADLYYLQELYPEAAANYETFRDLHPKHEKAEYAMFRIAKSYFMDIPSVVARDLTPAQKAQDAYNEFLKRFPASPDTVEARKDLAKTRSLLASKELYIGDFYYKRDFYESAKARYQKIIDIYPDTDIAVNAKQKLDKTNEQIDKNKPTD
jgi:outer membrane protein assembly factor BamD